jgi:hypothetical protein
MATRRTGKSATNRPTAKKKRKATAAVDVLLQKDLLPTRMQKSLKAASR